jgi:hypothetical protein
MMAQNVCLLYPNFNALILLEVSNVETYMLSAYLIFLREDYDNFDVDLRGYMSFYIV